MKQLRTPEQNLTLLFSYIADALRRAGVQVIDEGRIDRKSLKSISQSPDSVDEFHDYANGFWRDTMQAGETAY